jgi:VanZ family protein
MPEAGTETSAWPLALAYAGLVIYASLFPFSEWRNQGAQPWEFWFSPFPKYWTGQDLWLNLLGYAPLGFFLAVAACRSARPRVALLLAFVASGMLSLVLETTQVYLPTRVPSNLDVLMNAFGALLGGLVARVMHQLGALQRWSDWRAEWFVPEARGGLVLLVLWPAALLGPLAVPFGLGRVLEPLETVLAKYLEDTPFLALLPIRDLELQPLLPVSLVSSVMLSLLTPYLLGFCLTRSRWRRMILVGLAFLGGVLASCLSYGWSLGGGSVWAWINFSVVVGAVLSLVLAMAFIGAPERTCALGLLLSLAINLVLINQAATSVYFEQILQQWELGSGVRFYGVLEWLAWCWPYTVFFYAGSYLLHPRRRNSWS